MTMEIKVCLFVSNYVGYEILKKLVLIPVKISLVIIDKKDPGCFNDRIVSICHDNSIIYADYNENICDAISSLKIDLICLLWWSYIIKPEVYSIPIYGAINIHPALLPFNKGKDPNFWAIVDGNPTGVTIHRINEIVDSGDILFQSMVPCDWTDTGRTLYIRLLEESIRLFTSNAIKIFEWDVETFSQGKSATEIRKRADMVSLSQMQLDEPTTCREVMNIIRAKTFEGFPSAFFYDGGKKYNVTINIQEQK